MELSILEESQYHKYHKDEKRCLTSDEINLLKCLFDASGHTFNIDIITVHEMNDGDMGSLYFPMKEKKYSDRMFGKCIIEKTFLDEDGMPISVALNVDKEGILYELDIWRVDFQPLKRYPRC